MPVPAQPSTRPCEPRCRSLPQKLDLCQLSATPRLATLAHKQKAYSYNSQQLHEGGELPMTTLQTASLHTTGSTTFSARGVVGGDFGSMLAEKAHGRRSRHPPALAMSPDVQDIRRPVGIVQNPGRGIRAESMSSCRLRRPVTAHSSHIATEANPRNEPKTVSVRLPDRVTQNRKGRTRET